MNANESEDYVMVEFDLNSLGGEDDLDDIEWYSHRSPIVNINNLVGMRLKNSHP